MNNQNQNQKEDHKTKAFFEALQMVKSFLVHNKRPIYQRKDKCAMCESNIYLIPDFRLLICYCGHVNLDKDQITKEYLEFFEEV